MSGKTFSLANAKKAEEKFLMRVYPRQDALFMCGKGMYLYDEHGEAYLDFLSGIGVCALGHSPKVVRDALKKQSAALVHTCNLYYSQPMLELAEYFHKKTGGMLSFFCNSGAEANEAAIKLSRKWGKQNGGRHEIITMLNSFHGRTYGALSATGQEKFKKDFKPVVSGFKHVPFNDVRALEKAITAKTCAVMMEVIQGEGGVVCADENYLRTAAALCKRKNVLLIIDEVQTALRTGKFFAYEHFGIKPDIVTLAKPLASGLPLGAMCAKKNIAEVFQIGDHGTTFGGTPLVCAVSLAVLKEMEKKNFVALASQKGHYLRNKMNELKKKHNVIEGVRGLGLMLGIVFSKPVAKDVQKKCLAKKLVVNAPSANVIRLLPPLIVEKIHADKAVKILDDVLRDVTKEG